MITLPKTWQSCTLEDIARIVSGGTPKSTVEDNFCETGGIAWLTPADLSGYKAKTISKGKRNLTDKGYLSCSAKKMPKGSVLYSSRAPIGYVVIAENEISTNQGFKSFIPDKGIDSEYLYYYLKSIKHIAEANATGTTFKELSGTATKALPFIAPPATEQKRIVEKLDSLLAQVDTIQQRLNNLPDIIKRFRQSVLAAAVSGKLTEQWRKDNGILVNSYELPQRMVDLIQPERPISYGVLKPGPFVSGGVTLLRIKDILDTRISTDESHKISSELSKQYKRTLLKGGEILISLVGTIGRIGLVTKEFSGMNVHRNLAVIAPKKELQQKFIYWQFKSDFVQKQIQNARTGANQPLLNLGDIKKFNISVPTIEEQTEIVRLVEQYFALADTLEKNLANAKQRVDNLTQSILAKAFRGELVPQDPNDEPADKLLARIKAARLEAEKLEKAAKKAAKASKK
ncbi:restriction endonuclease subunit S [Pseudoalteromonas sp. MT33b]|jgi:type I restriction enzyme S subunit|uniref:restriction endonuclease subunit S n=1 Tax=Pseudoalteromonas sp. MT33b TaxID=2759705 RepID=UPI0015FC7FAE|nr:restriction endonuclease subunit S [Pseudoalteromonas sp. MT33b]QMW16841.1 restriction endonuclease subunit S [Pseudoalteromonas sp. MT33b]